MLRWTVLALLLAVGLFVASGGHLLFLPLFVALPLGGLFAGRRRRW